MKNSAIDRSQSVDEAISSTGSNAAAVGNVAANGIGGGGGGITSSSTGGNFSLSQSADFPRDQQDGYVENLGNFIFSLFFWINKKTASSGSSSSGGSGNGTLRQRMLDEVRSRAGSVSGPSAIRITVRADAVDADDPTDGSVRSGSTGGQIVCYFRVCMCACAWIDLTILF